MNSPYLFTQENKLTRCLAVEYSKKISSPQEFKCKKLHLMLEQVFKTHMGTNQHLELFCVYVVFACAYMYYIIGCLKRVSYPLKQEL